MTIIKQMIKSGVLSPNALLVAVADSLDSSDRFYNIGFGIVNNSSIIIHSMYYDTESHLPEAYLPRQFYKNETEEIISLADKLQAYLKDMELAADFKVVVPHFSDIIPYDHIADSYLGIQLIY